MIFGGLPCRYTIRGHEATVGSLVNCSGATRLGDWNVGVAPTDSTASSFRFSAIRVSVVAEAALVLGVGATANWR
jgi:hypothetical protein